MTKKKILIIRNAYSHDFGGGERFPVDLAHELKKLNYRPIVISRSPKLLRYSETQQVPTIKGWWWNFQDFSGKRALLFPLYIAWQLLLIVWYLSIIIRHQADIVHPQSRDDFIAATFAGKLLQKRVIWTDHADLKYVFQNHQTFYKNPVGKLVFIASLFTNHVILVSHSEKGLIEYTLGFKLSKKFHVIHNGISDRKNIFPNNKLGNKNNVTFASTSRLVSAKGIGELIEAFVRLNAELPMTKLWLFGEGPEEAKFKALAEDNKSIKFLGFPEDALEQVTKADIFVHPSYMEGFSISLVEAAMIGKPMIACEVGGNPELVNEQNGILIPPRDSNALYEAMRKLAIDKSLRLKLGNGARTTYEKNLNFEDIIKKRFIPLYEK